MATEVERVRDREPEASAPLPYDIMMKDRAAFVERQMTGKIVIKASDREWRQSRQGRAKWYLNPYVFTDTVLQEWAVFIADVRKHTGKHIHQGGLVLFVLEGKGWTVVDGVRYDWEAGDLVLLPIKPGGVEHQHFNTNPEQGAKWMAFIYWPFKAPLASELKQVENSPDFRG